ncbi:MAG: alpha/beta family hydrolase [Vicinamibacterales bacterium]
MSSAPEMLVPERFAVALPDGQAVTALHYTSAGSPSEDRGAAANGATLLLAHGAGAGQHSPFMTSFARAMAGRGIDTVTFNFLYVEQKRRLPDRAPVLEACYLAAIAETRRRLAFAGGPLFIGGKSMGGRIATQVAAADASLQLTGFVLLGYPLHPPGRPHQRRDAHLPRVQRPMLFVQGSRDAFGTPSELEPILSSLTPPAALHAVEGGDHSFSLPRTAAGRQTAVDDEIRAAVARWIRGHGGGGVSSQA